ncbi:hypothetical protein B9Z55_007743 [Caenorhabditis nigoni]|uniref:BTB domain-containing protein n=2 Tax=Caenorhabditis nigoni TaxID=1611254 RepID=A0A2G5VAZ9_9PELO|nr:hypothetical protein B9Z55_007743 [Caenorhabditis nigoni]
MPPFEKKFVLKHVFKKVSEMEEDKYIDSPDEHHFGLPWNISTQKKEGKLGFFLEFQLKKKEKWSIELKWEQKLLSMTGEAKTENETKKFENSDDAVNCWGWSSFISWDELIKNHVVDDSFSVEVHVEILKMTGINLRNFDKSAEKYSDVVLIVEGTKFYVLKQYLASQSSYFDSLLLGNFQESKKSEITLSDIKSEHFQHFLELIYGESSIDESTIDGIIHLSDMYDAKLAIRKCEEFLMENSEKPLKEKLKLASKYNLKQLKNDCLSKISSSSDIRSVLSYDSSEMDPAVVFELLQKSTFSNN